jgi:hypothetical protein
MLNVQTAENPQFTCEDKSQILLLVKFAEFQEKLPFTATSYDAMPYGVDLYNRALSEEFGPIAEYVAPPEPEAAENQPSVDGAQTL